MAIGTLAAIGLGASAIGGVISSSSANKAAGKAADVSLAVARENNALAQDIYGQNKSILSPSIGRGDAAGGAINALLGLSGDTGQGAAFDTFRNSTGYDFRFDEGMKGLNSLNAARGTMDSGDAVKSAIRYGQNFGSGEFGNYMGYLGNQQGVGLSAGSALAGVGQNYVNTISANNNNAGTAQANALLYKGSNNPLANGLGMIGGGLFKSSFGG